MISTNSFCWLAVKANSGLNLFSDTTGPAIGSPMEEITSITSGASFKRFKICVTLALETLRWRARAAGEEYSPLSKALRHSLARKRGFRYRRLPILMRLWLNEITGISKTARKVLCIDPFGEPICLNLSG